MRIAAWGWEHAAWTGVFYPDDLPPEWRLAYYANEFERVVVPAAVAAAVTEAAVAAWLEETGPHFRFLVEEGGSARDRESQRRCAAWLGERCAGLLRRDECRDPAQLPVRPAACAWWCPVGEVKPAEMGRVLRDCAALGPEALLVLGGEPPPAALLRSLRQLAELF